MTEAEKGQWLLYVMAAFGVDGPKFIKIGITSNLGARLQDVQVGCPLPIREVWTVDVGDMKTAHGVEHDLHDAFRKYHTWGEWFAFDLSSSEHKEVFNAETHFALNNWVSRTWKWKMYNFKELKDLKSAATLERMQRARATVAKQALLTSRKKVA